MPATFAGQFRTVIRNNRLQKKSALLDSALRGSYSSCHLLMNGRQLTIRSSSNAVILLLGMRLYIVQLLGHLFKPFFFYDPSPIFRKPRQIAGRCIPAFKHHRHSCQYTTIAG